LCCLAVILALYSPVTELAAAVTELRVLACVTVLSSASTRKGDFALGFTAVTETSLATRTAGLGITAALARRTATVAVERIQARESTGSTTVSIETGHHVTM